MLQLQSLGLSDPICIQEQILYTQNNNLSHQIQIVTSFEFCQMCYHISIIYTTVIVLNKFGALFQRLIYEVESGFVIPSSICFKTSVPKLCESKTAKLVESNLTLQKSLWVLTAKAVCCTRLTHVSAIGTCSTRACIKNETVMLKSNIGVHKIAATEQTKIQLKFSQLTCALYCYCYKLN